VHVDAQTGDLLVVYQMMPFGGGGTSVAVTPSPDLGPGPIAITDHLTKRSLAIPDATLASVDAPRTRPTGRKITLKRGRYSQVAWIDPASGLVWTQTKGRRKYAKLDKASLGSFQKILQSK